MFAHLVQEACSAAPTPARLNRKNRLTLYRCTRCILAEKAAQTILAGEGMLYWSRILSKAVFARDIQLGLRTMSASAVGVPLPRFHLFFCGAPQALT